MPSRPQLMRCIAGMAFAMLAGPVHGWEAGSEGALCTLTHSEPSADIRLTFDPSVPLYTITITTPEAWPVSPEFAMAFTGSRGNTITTNRHVLSPDGRSLSVSDRGFGNVLDGLQFNTTATGLAGGTSVTVSLEGAAPQVEAFRACGTLPSA